MFGFKNNFEHESTRNRPACHRLGESLILLKYYNKHNQLDDY